MWWGVSEWDNLNLSNCSVYRDSRGRAGKEEEIVSSHASQSSMAKEVLIDKEKKNRKKSTSEGITSGVNLQVSHDQGRSQKLPK